MKLLVLYSIKSKKIIALTEYNIRLYNYFIQRQLNKEEYSVVYTKKENEINKYLIKYENLLLDEYEDIVVTNDEQRLINRTFNTEHSRIRNILTDLLFIYENYDLNSEENQTIEESINIFSRLKKKRRLNSKIKIKEFIFNCFMDKESTICAEIQELDEKYYRI